MSTISEEILDLWPEIEWIEDNELREKVAHTWELALERSVLSADDLRRIPFTLLAGPDLDVSFMDHKRAVVHVSRDAAVTMRDFFADALPLDMDTVIAGAIR